MKTFCIKSDIPTSKPVPAHAMKAYEGVQVQLQTFLTSALDGASHTLAA